jgi:hypothetical protein
MALYGTERARREPRWTLLTVAGLVCLLLVKGLLAVFGPALCVLWLVTRRLPSAGRADSDRPAWLGIAAGVAAMGATAAVYELLYRQATAEPFWSFYATRQLGVAAAASAGSGLIGTLSNLVWYLGRVVWFPFPWSVLLVVTLWRGRARSGSVAETSRPDAGARAGALFTAAVVALYVGLFSLSDRRADRYVFPAYYAVGAAGGVAALRLVPKLRRLADRLDRPWLPPAVWAATFIAHLLAGRLGLPTVKLP